MAQGEPQPRFAKPELCHAVRENIEELLEVGYQGILSSPGVILQKAPLGRI